jgi:hypothetical protein
LDNSEYGKKAKELLERVVKEKQIIIDKQGNLIEELKKNSAPNETIEEEIKNYRQMVTESKDYVKKIELKLTDFIIQGCKDVSQKVALNNNYIIVYESKNGLDDITHIIITELDKKPTANIENYFNSIK